MSDNKSLMAGKRGLVMGVANERSIAWGIAQTLHHHGAALALTYQGGAFEKRVRPLAASLDAAIVCPCDVEDVASMDATFGALAAEWGAIDFVVHAMAYSDKEELKGRYTDTTRDNFLRTVNISCFSFTDIAKRAVPMMNGGGSLLTLTYAGSERVVPNYNVMGVAKAALETSVRYLAEDLGSAGIRVNGLSAGPMRTLAGSAIGSARSILKWNERYSPLRRGVRLEELGGAALYLLSDLSKGVTGEILHVDSGYNIVGVPSHPQEAS